MYAPLSNDQAKVLIDAEQLFGGYQDALVKYADYHGGMHWKTIAGKAYLYRTLDRKGNAKSLGVRSAETECTFEAFTSRKAMLKERVAELRTRLDVQKKVNAAYRLGHVPNEVAAVCQQLEKAQLMGTNIHIIGTNAIHAYAAMAGVRFSSDLMATSDVDLLWSHKSKISLAASAEISEGGLLGLLKRADSSYEIKDNQRFRAVSKTGFMVDLIRQTPTPPWRKEPDQFFANDLVAVDIWNMKWLLSAPQITHPVIAVNGSVFNMSVPDPRAFAMFKLWLSRSDEREAVKKGRDKAQATAVIELIQDRLPHLANAWSTMKTFPKSVRVSVCEEISHNKDATR